MKTSCLYSAIMMLLGPSFVFSMGLGDINVTSALNQRFYAEIPLLDVGNTPLNGIKASLASLDEFQRVGLELDDALSLFKFKVEKNKDGIPVIQITSDERVTEPYLQILVDLAWSNGQLYRSYTVLLDPPGYKLVTPASHINQVSSYKSTQEGELAPGSINKPIYTQVVKGDGGAVKHQRAEASYGPTMANESIWEIAQRYSTSDTTLQQIILAIVGTNSQAFTQGNLNGLKIGERLRIPSTEEVLKVPADLAKQEVDAQDVAWKTHQEIKHVLLPPYIDGVAGVSQFKSDTEDNSLNKSDIAPAPVFKSATLNPPVVSSLPPMPVASAPVNTGIFNPVSYIPPIIGMTPINGEKNTTVDKLLNTENSLLKTQLNDLQAKNSQLQKVMAQQSQDFQALRQQMQAIGAGNSAQKSQNAAGAAPSSTHKSSGFWLYLLLIAGLAGGAGLCYWIMLRRSEEVFDEKSDEPTLSPRLSPRESNNVSSDFIENPPTVETATITMPAEESAIFEAAYEDNKELPISELKPASTPEPSVSAPSSLTTISSPEIDTPVAVEQVNKEDSIHEEIPLEPASSDEVVLPSRVEDHPAEQAFSNEEKPIHVVDFEPGLDKFIASNKIHAGTSPGVSDEQSINFETTNPDKKRRKTKQPENLLNANFSEISNTADNTEKTRKKIEPVPLDKGFESTAPKLAKSKAALDTLLALAKTYMSMEDFETAKQSLEEVLNFGNENQKAEAQKLIDELKNK